MGPEREIRRGQSQHGSGLKKPGRSGGLLTVLASIFSTTSAEWCRTFVRHLDQTLCKSAVGESTVEVIAGLVARGLGPGKANR
jgi:hypothetical protein